MRVTEKQTAGDHIVNNLLANGVDTVFGLPGAQTYPIFDALARSAPAIRTVSARHEQATAYMALGYAKSTGRPGVYSVVPGPGVLNTAAALCTAYGVNAPVMCLTGQVPSEFLGSHRGHLHEVPDQLALLASFIKAAYRIEHPQDTHRVMAQAWRSMISGRQGPVSVEMCWDTMAMSAQLPEPRRVTPDDPPTIDDSAIAAAAKFVTRGKRPMIMVGGGAQHAGTSVLELAEHLNCPVVSHRGGKGVIAGDHPLAVDCASAIELWAETDVLIGIGSRLELQYMRWTGMQQLIRRPEPPPHVIRIDIDPAEMRRLKPHVPVIADADDGTRALLHALKSCKAKSGTEARLSAARETMREAINAVQPQMSYLHVIREELPHDGIFVDDLCQVVYASYFGWTAFQPRTYVTCGYQGTLGYGYPTALGVKIANSDRAVLSILGDGGFMFAVQELATAVQEDIGVIAIVFNNASYGNVRRDQKRLFDNRVNASELRNPDFMALVASFGAAGYQVNSPEELRPALRQAIEDDKPAVIEVIVDPDSEASPWDLLIRRPQA
ncbi:MAG: thiamine pyrophosphate-dependent enzyme [Hyphomicrobiaceae bacterium]